MILFIGNTNNGLLLGDTVNWPDVGDTSGTYSKADTIFTGKLG
jgi:hypothetical protein